MNSITAGVQKLGRLRQSWRIRERTGVPIWAPQIISITFSGPVDPEKFRPGDGSYPKFNFGTRWNVSRYFRRAELKIGVDILL